MPIIRDRTDDDFCAIVFAPDQKLRFRAVTVECRPTLNEALATLNAEMDAAAAAPPEEHYQGDELGTPVDFFTPVRPEAELNPNFVALSQVEGYSPARGIIEPMMRWYEDADGNFVEQFQTTGFDQR